MHVDSLSALLKGIARTQEDTRRVNPVRAVMWTCITAEVLLEHNVKEEGRASTGSAAVLIVEQRMMTVVERRSCRPAARSIMKGRRVVRLLMALSAYCRDKAL